jgi:protein O-GlcNAc transferase
MQLGQSLTDQGNYCEALECLRKAFELDPSNARILTLIGEVLVRQEDYGKAEQCFRKAIEIDPHCSKAFERFGLFKAEQDKDDS